MTGFANVLDGVKHWLGHLLGTATAKQIVSAGKDVTKQILINGAMAGLAAHASGSDKDATEKAILAAAEHTVATVGVTVGTEQLQNLVAHISDSIHAAPETAPAPPTG